MNNQRILVLLIILLGCLGLLQAQYADEEKLLMQQYKLPEGALPDSIMTEIDSVMYLDGEVFNGTAFSRYENGQLQHVSQYVQGRKHGSTLVWYPDGKPQLMAHYRQGYLNGRFKGWYQFGAVIYDLVMRESAFKGDQLYDTDSQRETATVIESEPTGDSREQVND